MCPSSPHFAPSSQVWSQKVEVPSKLSAPQPPDCSACPSRTLEALPHPQAGVWHKKCDEVSLGDWGRKRKAMTRKASQLGRSWAGHHARRNVFPLHTQKAPVPSNAPSWPPLPICWQGEERQQGAKGEWERTWFTQTSPRPRFLPLCRGMLMRQGEGLINKARPFSGMYPQPILQRKSH